MTKPTGNPRGRRPKVSDQQITDTLELDWETAAEKLGITRSTVYRRRAQVKK